MQPVSGAAAEVLQAASLTVGFGVELLDASNAFMLDLSDDVAGGEVDYDTAAEVHGSLTLNLSRALTWGVARVRPYMVLSAAGVSARWNLGVYVLATPTRPIGETPETYAVTGYGLLYLLTNPIGSDYTVPAGTGYLEALADVFTAAGVTALRIDQSAASALVPVDMVWPLDSSNTGTRWLDVAVALCKAVGYRPPWMDWDGYGRADPWIDPATRAAEWTFDTGTVTSLVEVDRTQVLDLWNHPNWWRFVAQNWATPVVEGDGQFTFQNASDGPASIASVGRVVRKPVEFVDVADQAALVTYGQQVIARDRKVANTLTVATAPFPAAWHEDVYTYSDGALGGPMKVQAQSWKLPLDGWNQSGTHMEQVWQVVG